MTERETPEVCPNCGALVPENARACPECGADEETGWNDVATEQRLGIADPDDFDADEFQRNEEGETPRRPLAWLWWLTATLLLLATAAGIALSFLRR